MPVPIEKLRPMYPDSEIGPNLACLPYRLELGEEFGAEPIAGPCTYCGSPDHWRPDCPQIPKDRLIVARYVADANAKLPGYIGAELQNDLAECEGN